MAVAAVAIETARLCFVCISTLCAERCAVYTVQAVYGRPQSHAVATCRLLSVAISKIYSVNILIPCNMRNEPAKIS